MLTGQKEATWQEDNWLWGGLLLPSFLLTTCFILDILLDRDSFIYNFTLQFSPSDPSKLVVTSADSLVRVISGLDVICKFRGWFLFLHLNSYLFFLVIWSPMVLRTLHQFGWSRKWDCDFCTSIVSQPFNINILYSLIYSFGFFISLAVNFVFSFQHRA